MIDPIYTLTQSEILLLTSLLNQLDIWFDSDISQQVKSYLEPAISSGKMAHDDIKKLLLLLKKAKKQKQSRTIQKVYEPETASDSWDEMLELMENQKKNQAKQVALDASLRSHLQSAVYNKNLPNRCVLALRKVISPNIDRRPGFRRHI